MWGIGSARGTLAGEAGEHDVNASTVVARGIRARAKTPKSATFLQCVVTLIVLRSWTRTIRALHGTRAPEATGGPAATAAHSISLDARGEIPARGRLREESRCRLGRGRNG